VKKFGFVLLLLLTLFVVTGFLLPKQVHVERSITVERPQAMVFALLNGYQHFRDYSPWVARDPAATYSVSGPVTGVGAHLDWSGDPQLVGSGWQEIVASVPDKQIDIRLDYDSQGTATTHFYLQEDGDGARVTWAFDADVTAGLGFVQGFLARYFGLLFDRWVGRDFERGLVNLKKLAESMSLSEFNPPDIIPVRVKAQDILFVTVSSSQEPKDIAMAMASAYAEVGAFIQSSGIEVAGQPMAITRAWEDGEYLFDAAIPVNRVPAQLSGHIKAGQSPSGAAIRAVHRGSSQHLMPTYERLAAYMTAHGLGQGDVSWEQYVSDPKTTPEKDRVTYVYIMLGGHQDGPQ